VSDPFPGAPWGARNATAARRLSRRPQPLLDLLSAATTNPIAATMVIAGTKLDTCKTLDELASVSKAEQPTRGLLSAWLHLDGDPGPCVYPPLMRQGGGRQLRRRTQANAA
jgi:hypothetical protein